MAFVLINIDEGSVADKEIVELARDITKLCTKKRPDIALEALVKTLGFCAVASNFTVDDAASAERLMQTFISWYNYYYGARHGNDMGNISAAYKNED